MQKFLNYLSFQGRTNRARYWLTTLAIFGITMVCAVSAASAATLLPFLGIVLIPVFVVVLYASLANAARRLHDRGKSAWWLLLFAVLPALLSIPAQMTKGSSDEGAQMFGAMFALLSLPFSVWGFVEIGCLRGTSGPNRFGDDPLVSTQAEEVLA